MDASFVRFNEFAETLVEGKHPNADVERMILKQADMSMEEDLAVAANGARYSKEKTGMMPELVIKMYAERVAYKKEMLKQQQKLVDIEKEMKKRGLV